MMNLRNYAENSELELLRCAMEKFNTYREVYDEICSLREGEAIEFDRIIRGISYHSCELDEAEKAIKEERENYEKMQKLNASKIGQMMREFCANNTPEKLQAIKDFLESENEFAITVNDKQDEIARNAKRELAYCFIRENHFYVDSIYKYYKFSNFDLDEDMKICAINIEDAEFNIKNHKQELEDLKNTVNDDECFDYLLNREESLLWQNLDCDYEDY